MALEQVRVGLKGGCLSVKGGCLSVVELRWNCEKWVSGIPALVDVVRTNGLTLSVDIPLP